MTTAPDREKAGTEAASPMGGPRPRWAAQMTLTVALVLLGTWMLRGLLVPLVWGTILAFASWPLYIRFAGVLRGRQRLQRLAPALFTLLVGLIFLVPLALVALEFAHDAPNVAHWVKSIEAKGLAAPEWLATLPMIGGYASDWWQANLSNPHAASELLGRLDREVFIYWAGSVGTQVFYRITDLLFTLMTLFFLFRHGAGIARQLLSLAEVVLGDTGERLLGHMQSAVRGAVNGLVLVGFGEGLVLGAAYAACGVPHPVVMGALTGIVAAIPFGVFVMFGAGAALLFAQSSPGAAVVLLGIGVAVLVLADYFLRPLVIGSAAKLPFLWVLFGILGGLESFGLVGLFLGPAVLACLLALWRDLAGPQVERSP